MKIKDLLNKEDITKEEKNIILSEILNMSIPDVKINKEKELSKKEYNNYSKILKKVEKGLPVQYALKKAYFYGDSFYVNKNVLIPRPETEYLVEKIDKLIKGKFNNDNIKILDIGTGSGVIAITLSKLNKKADITATDISKKALKIAEKNNKNRGTNVNFIHTNLYDDIKNEFDVIISNPPYIDFNSKLVEEKVKREEPHIALFAEDNGLYFYKEILKNLKKVLKKDHIIAFEIGDSQGKELSQMAKNYFPKDEIYIEKDYNKYDRYLFIVSKN